MLETKPAVDDSCADAEFEFGESKSTIRIRIRGFAGAVKKSGRRTDKPAIRHPPEVAKVWEPSGVFFRRKSFAQVSRSVRRPPFPGGNVWEGGSFLLRGPF